MTRAPMSEKARENCRKGRIRYYARKREEQWVTTADVENLRKPTSPASPALRVDARAAAVELEVLVAALGGPENISPQREILAADASRLGLVARALMRLFAQSESPEVASRIATVLTARRATLAALGLDEHRAEHDLESYLA